jgi:hypothetical protein
MTNKEDKINEILEELNRRYKQPNIYRDSYITNIVIEDLSAAYTELQGPPKNVNECKEANLYIRSFLKKHPHLKELLEKRMGKYFDHIYYILTTANITSGKKVKVYYYVEFCGGDYVNDFKYLSETYTYDEFVKFLKENI